MRRLLVGLGVAAVLAVTSACDTTFSSEPDRSDPEYWMENCEEVDREHPEWPGSVEECAEDAAELAEEMAEYGAGN